MDEERLQKYYKSCNEYFKKLKGEEFDTLFLKHYKILHSEKKEKRVLDVRCDVGSRRKILEMLSTLPLFRNVGGEIFLVGKLVKTRVHNGEEFL